VLADLAAPSAVPDEAKLALEEPVTAAWAVGSMQLAYDSSADRVVLVAREVGADEGESAQGEEAGEVGTWRSEGLSEGLPAEPAEGTSPEGPERTTGVARVLLTREQAAGVIEHGKRLLRRGRPPCPFCGYPLDQDHSCPKMNGHQAPSL